MHSSLFLGIPLLCGVLIIFQALPSESLALPTNVNLLQSNSTPVSTPPKRFKQDDTEDEEGDGDTDSETGSVPAGAAGGDPVGLLPNGALMSTYNNVGTILSGILDGRVGDVLTGGTAFIPPGDLRNNVNLLLTGAVIPSVERVAQNVGPYIQARFNETTTTPIPTVFRSGSRGTTTESSLFSNPLKFIQNRIGGGGGGGGETGEDSNPLKAIGDRLQSLISNLGGNGNNEEKVSPSRTRYEERFTNPPTPTDMRNSNRNVNRVNNNIQSGIYNSNRNVEGINENFQGGIYNVNRNAERINNNFQNELLNSNRYVDRINNNNNVQSGTLNSNLNLNRVNNNNNIPNSNIVRVNNAPPSSNSHYAPDPVNINRYRESIPASPL